MVDALLLAYVAVSNVLHKYEDGEVTVRFIAAKAKVAPTKAALVPVSYTHLTLPTKRIV